MKDQYTAVTSNPVRLVCDEHGGTLLLNYHHLTSESPGGFIPVSYTRQPTMGGFHQMSLNTMGPGKDVLCLHLH